MEPLRNLLAGIGRKLKLHIIIPTFYVVTMIVALIITHGK